MNKKYIIAIVLLFVSLVFLATYNYKADKTGIETENHTMDFSSYKIGVLSKTEKQALITMREEEKFARDVYRELSKTTKSKVFINIPISEGRHMDVFDQLIDRYELEDPIKDESAIGIFTDKKFANLFTDFTKEGKKSDKNAFLIGAAVEDINMSNLIKYRDETTKKDLVAAYSKLLEQSKYHMAAFIRQLERLNTEFIPKYITTQQLSEAIKAGSMHHKRYENKEW
jgi:hypothetical protein